MKKMNKKGAQNAMIWVVIVLVGGFLLMQGGFFDTTEDVDDASPGTGVAPSDLQTTFDMAWKSELATTETAVSSALWYAFRAADGSYVNSGTASSGTASFTTNYGEDYDVWSYTAAEGGYIAKKVRISATAAKVPVTITLIRRGGLEISGVDDPVDLNANITGASGATEEFRAKWKVNLSNSGSLNPIFYIETNNTKTGIEDVTQTKTDSAGGSYTEVTCPDVLTPSSVNEVFYCFQRDKMALATDGIIITSFIVKIDGTVTPGADLIKVRMMDTGMYLKPGYTNIDGVLFAAENDANTRVGVAADAAVANLGLEG